MGDSSVSDDWSNRRMHWCTLQCPQLQDLRVQKEVSREQRRFHTYRNLRYVSNKWQRLLEALLVAAVSAFTGFVTLFIVDDCVPIGLGMNKTEGLNRVWY